LKRTSSPESLEELKALQAMVKKVVATNSVSTVGILIGQGAGSGVIVSEDGLVLTAAHVIGKPRQSCVLVLNDGQTVRGETLGVNAKADSGLLKITGKPPANATWPGAKEGKWPAVKMGSIKEMGVGQWLVALGHPGGPKKDRPPPVRVGRYRVAPSDKINPAMGTDCTLVGGDSGGPLFNLAGEVVGIHSRIGLFLETNMHIPTDKFQDEWTRLVRGDIIGRKTDAELGIAFKSDPKSATVQTVTEDGPAWQADIEEGDVIKKLNGFTVANADDLADMLSSYNAGDKIKLDVLRGKKTLTIEVKLGRKANSGRKN
jgi:serine protease Do